MTHRIEFTDAEVYALRSSLVRVLDGIFRGDSNPARSKMAQEEAPFWLALWDKLPEVTWDEVTTERIPKL